MAIERFEIIAKKRKDFALPSGKTVSIGVVDALFPEWKGPPIADTYGGKALIEYEGQPLFAELVILRQLERQGWQGVWVDNFRGVFRTDLPEKAAPVKLQPFSKRALEMVIEKNGSLKGCWDVFAWKEDSILFVESKRLKKDSIRDTQKAWAAAVLNAGFSVFCLISGGMGFLEFLTSKVFDQEKVDRAIWES